MGRQKEMLLSEVYARSSEVFEPKVSYGDLRKHKNKHFSCSESDGKKESNPCNVPSALERVAFPKGKKADEFSDKIVKENLAHQCLPYEVDRSLCSKKYDSSSDDSVSRSLNSPKDKNNASRSVAKDPLPNDNVSSKKSNDVLIQGTEEQGESSTQPDKDENERDVTEKCSVKSKRFMGSAVVLEKSSMPGIMLQRQSVDGNIETSALKQVNFCSICGILGSEESRAFCGKCGNGAEHTYCMHVKLKKAPGNWICKECMVAEQVKKLKKDDVSKGAVIPGSEINGKNFVESNHVGLVIGKRKENGWSSLQLAKRPMFGSEAVPMIGTRSSKETNTMSSWNLSLNMFGKGKTVQTDSLINLTSSLKPGLFNKAALYEKAQPSKEFVLPGKSSWRSANCSEKSFPSNKMHYPSDFAYRFLAYPLPCHTWQGGFEIKRNRRLVNVYDGIQGHLTGSASQNMTGIMLEFARIIVLEEIPRSTVWPTQLSEYHSAADNIAIYFFAKDLESYERSYSILSEYMIKTDVCLKGKIDGLELLIFSSNSLPENLKLWNGAFFIWGLFRVPSSGSDVSCDKRGLKAARRGINPVTHEFLPAYSNQAEEKDSKMSMNRVQEIREGGSESRVPNHDLSPGFGGASADDLQLSLALSLSNHLERHDVDTSLSLLTGCDRN